MRRLGCLAIVRGRDAIQSRLNSTSTTQASARVQTFRGAVSPLAAFSRSVRVVVATSSGAYANFGETQAVALRRQRDAQRAAGPSVGERSSTRRCTPVVASRPGFGHRQPGRHHVYTAVNDDHQCQRYVERTHGGVNLVAEILT